MPGAGLQRPQTLGLEQLPTNNISSSPEIIFPNVPAARPVQNASHGTDAAQASSQWKSCKGLLFIRKAFPGHSGPLSPAEK